MKTQFFGFFIGSMMLFGMGACTKDEGSGATPSIQFRSGNFTEQELLTAGLLALTEDADFKSLVAQQVSNEEGEFVSLSRLGFLMDSLQRSLAEEMSLSANAHLGASTDSSYFSHLIYTSDSVFTMLFVPYADQVNFTSHATVAPINLLNRGLLEDWRGYRPLTNNGTDTLELSQGYVMENPTWVIGKANALGVRWSGGEVFWAPFPRCWCINTGLPNSLGVCAGYKSDAIEDPSIHRCGRGGFGGTCYGAECHL